MTESFRLILSSEAFTLIRCTDNSFSLFMEKSRVNISLLSLSLSLLFRVNYKKKKKTASVNFALGVSQKSKALKYL